MKKILLSTLLILAFAATSYAIPVRTAEKGTVEQRTFSPAQDLCYIGYYNFCSGWVFYHDGYCGNLWAELTGPAPQWGTVFDLADCPINCRHLTVFWVGVKRYTTYGNLDVEVFCTNDCGCPIGPPLVGFYGYNPVMETAWQVFQPGDIPVCECDVEFGLGGKFAIIVTDNGYGGHTSPYSDIEPWNIDAGCETEWTCVGHSFHWRNLVDYCSVYGVPGPMWIEYPGAGCTNVPTVPPGCHDYYGYGVGFFSEFLIDLYLACLGPTATETNSWSEIKSLYR